MERGIKTLIILFGFVLLIGMVSGSSTQYGYQRYIRQEIPMAIHTWQAYNYMDLGNYTNNMDFMYWLNSTDVGFSVDFYYNTQSLNYTLDISFTTGDGRYVLIELRNFEANMNLVLIVNGTTKINTKIDDGNNLPLYVDLDRVGNDTTIRVSYMKNGEIKSNYVKTNMSRPIQFWAEAYGDDISASGVFYIKNVRIYWIGGYNIELKREIQKNIPLFLIFVEIGGLIGWMIIRD